MFHEPLAATADMAVLPGVLGCRALRRTVQVRLGSNTLRLPGGMAIFTVSRQQFMNCPDSQGVHGVTRLTEIHIQEAKEQLQRIDLELYRQARMDLRGVALTTIGIEDYRSGELPQGLRLAVVPITSGEGIIFGFAETVCGIATHVGFHAWKTSGSDVAGIAEAYANGADILMLADDHRFVAINTRSRSITDNNRATGESFAVLLDMMAHGVAGRACGVIGCGPVGSASALRLAQMGAELTVCDANENRARRLASEIRAVTGMNVQWVSEVEALTDSSLHIVDATPASGIIDADAIGPDTVIVAPGVPHGLTPEALARIGPRFYHDALPLGVATMALAAAFNQLTELRIFGDKATGMSV